MHGTESVCKTGQKRKKKMLIPFHELHMSDALTLEPSFVNICGRPTKYFPETKKKNYIQTS